MRFVDEFRDRGMALALAREIAARCEPGRRYKFMEVCGGHTHTIYKHGVEDYLPPEITLVHGPGCPVCVIPMGRIDDAIVLADEGIERVDRTSDRFYQTELRRLATRAQADRAESARASRDGGAVAEAVAVAVSHRDALRQWLTEMDGGAYGGLLATDAAIATAEVRRAEGIADPGAWRAAVAIADDGGNAWRRAYVRFRLAEGARVVVRPSGTEPKLKCYLEVVVPVTDGVDAARIAAAGRLDAIRSDLAAALGL